MYMLTGRLCANSSAVCQTLSAAHPMDFLRTFGREWRGNVAETLEDRLAEYFFAVFAFERLVCRTAPASTSSRSYVAS